ncbi:MAG: hypothetical protein HFJ35_07505, partial [Clostridia bacterium]|nr:hypothetical protein [Clostridia bacterium]
KANTQTKQLDNTSTNIDKILESLKPTKLNKNNMIISNEDVQKIKNYTNDKDNNYKIVSNDLYKNGIFDNNDNEIANNIARKVTIPDEHKQTKNKKKNNDTRF